MSTTDITRSYVFTTSRASNSDTSWFLNKNELALEINEAFYKLTKDNEIVLEPYLGYAFAFESAIDGKTGLIIIELSDYCGLRPFEPDETMLSSESYSECES